MGLAAGEIVTERAELGLALGIAGLDSDVDAGQETVVDVIEMVAEVHFDKGLAVVASLRRILSNFHTRVAYPHSAFPRAAEELLGDLAEYLHEG